MEEREWKQGLGVDVAEVLMWWLMVLNGIRVRSRNYGSVITGTVTGNDGNRKSKNYG